MWREWLMLRIRRAVCHSIRCRRRSCTSRSRCSREMLPICGRRHRASTPTGHRWWRHGAYLAWLLRELPDWCLSALLIVSLLLIAIGIPHLLLSVRLLCHLGRIAVLLRHALLMLLHRLHICIISEIMRLR